MPSSVTQYGITWTFNHSYTVGQFVNGDYYVVGPVTIIGIDPASVDASGRIINGSMVNPSPTLGNVQGYDSQIYWYYSTPENYSAALNVSFGVSPSTPLVLANGSSLVSAISFATIQRPAISDSAILTVLASAPAAGSFRPPYSGTDKTIRYNKSQLNYSILRTLAPTASTPSLLTVEAYFQRPWIDHIPGWVTQHTHPANNMPSYGTDLAGEINVGALMLQLNLTNAQKETLLVRYVQLGIDLFGIVSDGGQNNWVANGGHGSGRKWPILFSGLVLDDRGMISIGADSTTHFGEDDQTFYVAETSPGVYNQGYGGYGASDVGLPEYGITHASIPSADSNQWSAPYRQCCTAFCWSGAVLAARMMGAKNLWNHNALFDYQDRYMNVTAVSGSNPGWRAITPFNEEMWDTYRAQFTDQIPTGGFGLGCGMA